MKTSVIGISGRKRSGKDSTARFIQDFYGGEIISFADPIKETCRLIFGFTDKQLHGALKEKVDPYWHFTPRWAMQMVGTDLFREMIDKEVWVKSLIRTVERMNTPLVIVPDVRFPNEASAIDDLGGFLMRVERPVLNATEPQTRWKLHLKKYWPNLAYLGERLKLIEFGPQYHASETSMALYEDYDATVVNDRRLADLREKVEAHQDLALWLAERDVLKGNALGEKTLAGKALEGDLREDGTFFPK